MGATNQHERARAHKDTTEMNAIFTRTYPGVSHDRSGVLTTATNTSGVPGSSTVATVTAQQHEATTSQSQCGSCVAVSPADYFEPQAKNPRALRRHKSWDTESIETVTQELHLDEATVP